MQRKSGRAVAETRLEHQIVIVVAAVLAAKGDRRVGEETIQARGIGLAQGRLPRVGHPVGAVRGEDRQHLHAGIEQGAVSHRKQQVFKPPVDPAP